MRGTADATASTAAVVPRVVAAASALLLIAAPLPAQQLSPTQIERLVEANVAGAFDLYRELLSYPNDAHDGAAIARLFDWLDGAFRARGFATTRIETPGHPLLLAERRVPGATRTALIYLQADGQPVDPSRWEQPDPYRAVLKERVADGGWRELPWERLYGQRDPEWRVFARSAADSKGPVAQFLTAVSLLDDAGVSPTANLKVIVDFEEEQGSPNLPDAVVRYRDRLSADMLVIFDGPPHISGAPTLTFGARGITTVTLTAHGPRVPQHSGHYGNYAPNPALRLAQLLASMKDHAGRVTIPGWYDGVRLTDGVRAILAAVPDDEADIRRRIGIADIDSVATTLQEARQYPSLNIRGMQSAWIGTGARTIIPATATAEIDIRLVEETDPDRLIRLLRRHIEQQRFHIVDDRDPTEEERMTHARLVTMSHTFNYAAFRTDFDALPGRWLARALTRLNGEPPIRIRTSGGSIPIAPFVATLGVPAVTVPTVNPDNNQHSPNENLRVADFVRGIATMMAVLVEPVGR